MDAARLRRWSQVLVGVVALGSLAACAEDGSASGDDSANEEKGTVFFLNPGQTSVRWTQFDGPLIEKKLKEAGYGFEMLDAGQDPAKQQSQMESAVAQGAVGVIMVAPEASQAVGAISVAQAADIPVVEYVHDVVGVPEGSVDAFIGTALDESTKPYVDSILEEVEAKGSTPENPFRLAMVWGTPSPIADYVDQQWHDMVQPQLDSGQVEIVCRDFAADYTAAAAQQVLEQCLTKTSNGVDGVITLNDDQSGGVFAALKDQGLVEEGVKIFGGYDATLEGVQRVLAGYQKLTAYPDYDAASSAAVDVIVAAIEGDEPPSELDSYYLKGAEVEEGTEGAIPAVFIGNQVVTADNVQETIVDVGVFYTKDELCTGMAAESEYCTSG